MKNCSVPLKQPDRSKWIDAIEKVQPFDYIIQMYYLCQFHFSPDDIETRGRKKIVLPGRVPSIFANYSKNTLECFDVNTIDTGMSNDESTNSNLASNSVFLGQNILNIHESNETVSSSSPAG